MGQREGFGKGADRGIYFVFTGSTGDGWGWCRDGDIGTKWDFVSDIIRLARWQN